MPEHDCLQTAKDRGRVTDVFDEWVGLDRGHDLYLMKITTTFECPVCGTKWDNIQERDRGPSRWGRHEHR